MLAKLSKLLLGLVIAPLLIIFTLISLVASVMLAPVFVLFRKEVLKKDTQSQLNTQNSVVTVKDNV